MERLEQLSDKCVIDVGINNGNDTIMYLTQGYYVYGIDADPDMVHLAKNRIPAIYKDRYNITNIGISDKCETIDFYINHFSGFNSFVLLNGIILVILDFSILVFNLVFVAVTFTTRI